MTLSFPAFARRPRTPALAAMLAVLALLVGVVSPAAATAAGGSAQGVDASSATPAPTPTGTPAEELTFTVAPSAAGVVVAGAPTTVTVAARNPTGSLVAEGAVRLSTSATALSTRAELQAWISDPTDAARTGTVLADAALPAVAARSDASADIAVDAAALASFAPGVYPLRAQYTTTNGTLVAGSTLVVSAPTGTGALAVIVPITGPRLTSGLLDEAELASLTGVGGALREQLDAVTGTPVVLAVDPAIVAAVRVLGADAPPSARRWLDDLMSLPNPRFALQFGDADLAVQVAAGLAMPLAVTTLAPYLASGEAAAVTPAPSAAATPASPVPTPPAADDLTDIGAEGPPVLWPATGSAGRDTVAALSIAEGTAGAAAEGTADALTLIDSGALADGAPAGAWASASGSRVLVYDAEASRALSEAAGSDSVAVRARALATASSYAALATAASPDAPLLVTIDRSQTRTAAGLRAAISAAVTLSGRTATDLATLTAGAPVEVALDAVAAPPERVAELSGLLTDEESLNAFSTILADPTVLTAPERASILQLIGNGWREQPAEATDAVTAHRAQTASTLGAVSVAPPSDITLAATSAPLSFSVRNELRWPVSVVLTATPHDPRLVVQRTTAVEVGAAQNTRVQVPVESRVGSGESTLQLQLRSPMNVPLGDPVAVHIAVHAEWESVGVTVMAVLVGGMLILGIVRTVRRRREKEAVDG